MKSSQASFCFFADQDDFWANKKNEILLKQYPKGIFIPFMGSYNNSQLAIKKVFPDGRILNCF